MLWTRFLSLSVNYLCVSTFCAGTAAAQTTETTAPARTARTDLRVVGSLEYDLGDRTVTFHRVEPPVPRPVPAPVAVPLSPEVEEANRRRANKKFEVLSLSATVHDRRVTEVRWTAQGREYHAFSNRRSFAPQKISPCY